VVVPAYNEEARVGRALQGLVSYLRGTGLTWELLFVDDASRDATPRLLRAAASRNRSVRLVRMARNQGKGGAVRAGFREARGNTVIFTDCDLSTPPREIGKALAVLRRGADVAIASRHMAGSRIPVPQPLLRRLAGRMFNLATQVLLGLPWSDTQCGFKAFTRRAARVMAREGRIRGFAFDVELLLLARRFGLKVREFPVTWSDHAHTTVRLAAHAPGMFGVLFRLQRRFKTEVGYHPARALPLILTSVAGAIAGQIFMKTGSSVLAGHGFDLGFLSAVASNRMVWLGLACYGASAVTWLMALSKVDLSFAFPMLSLGFVITALYSWLFFGEILYWNRVLGIALVVTGVLVIAASGRTALPEEGS
jgi:glycosyltransferase involved in cell wall biosynthesis